MSNQLYLETQIFKSQVIVPVEKEKPALQLEVSTTPKTVRATSLPNTTAEGEIDLDEFNRKLKEDSLAIINSLLAGTFPRAKVSLHKDFRVVPILELSIWWKNSTPWSSPKIYSKY
ncbi:hypothetical protein SESBI_11881 [Sesbania bispinosa]|nr:hypothetical protein SESBI_11881 [Sesbania bispinosa]